MPIFLLVPLTACTGAAVPATGTADIPAPDLEVDCAGVWPAPTCLGGCAGAEEQQWAAGYLDHVSAAWGVPAAPFVEVRHVAIEGTPSRHATLDVQLVSDWVVSVFQVRASLPGPPATAADARAAFDPHTVPQVDLTVAPRPWSEVATFIADCEADLQVTFPEPWCTSYVTLDPGDDDQAGVRFDFQEPLSSSEYADAHVYAWGSEPDRCDKNQYLVD